MPQYSDIVQLMHIIDAMCILLAFVDLSCIKRAFEKKIPLFLGRISFAVYLIHPLIVLGLDVWLLLYFTPRFGYNISYLLLFILSNILDLLLGTSFNVLEKKMACIQITIVKYISNEIK